MLGRRAAGTRTRTDVTTRSIHGPQDHRDRHRLSRRHPRRGHGRARLRGPRPGRRPREDRHAAAGRGPDVRARSRGPAAQARRRDRGLLRPAALHDGLRGGRRLRRRALRVREHPAAARRVRRRHELRELRDRLAGPAPDRSRAGRRQVHGAGGHGGPSRRLPGRARAGRRGRGAGLEPGVPARGLRGRRHPAPGPDRGRRARRSGREAAPRGVRDAAVRGHAVRGDGLPHRRTGEDLGELLPGHQDLVHQRDGRGVRGGGRRRRQAGRGDRLRRPDRQEIPAGRHRFRRRLPAQGHPRVHGARRRAGRGPGADLPAGDRLHQHAPARPDGGAGPGGAGRRAVPRQAGRGARRHVQAGLGRRPRLPRAERRGADPPAGRPGHRVRPQGHGERAAGLPDAGLRGDGRGRRARGGDSAPPDRVARVP